LSKNGPEPPKPSCLFDSGDGGFPLLRRRPPQHFVAFDVLWLNGQDLSGKLLIERKRVLRSLLAPVAASPILFADYFDGRGVDLYREVCRMDLEGIVAKRKDGL
jgi:bifunctional non-homologous end joining protein LigD